MEAVISALIPAIVESVFGALTEAVGLSDWLRQRLGRDPEKLAFRQALTQALTDSDTHYPGRDLRYFAEILCDIGGPLLARTLQPAAPLPTADELTTIWLNHLTVDSLIHYQAEFTQFATHFLDRLHFHLENQQPLHWIAQARHERSSEEVMHRMANAAEQSATTMEVLRQEVAHLTATLSTVLQASGGSTVTTGGGTHNAGKISAQNFVGRDLTINQYFVQGLARLVFNYSARIENFLFEYLGGQGQRVPFGGRQKQIDQLNTWLDDPGAAPYLLMVAEAGGGKSALVTRWSAQLTTRTDLEVIFVPISIRFQTAAQDVAFAALAARLAQIYEQQSTLPAALSAEQWKGQCETYLRLPLPAGKRLLVVIDGLDEATGWEAGPELFAKRPPAGLRILVTARVRAKEMDADRWAMRLGWQNAQIAHKFHLPGLDRIGIAEALASMGNPLDHLATQVDLVGELHRLSQGDPLVVRLYVKALQEMGATVARLRPEDLTDIEPGLDSFMDCWWADQRKQWQMQGKDPFAEEERLLPLLYACTVAYGPLLLNDLAELDKQHFGKGLLVTHMAELLGRWVIGDGKKQGYVFSHPRLRDYFGGYLNPDEQCEWQAKFCSWGERVLTALNTGALDPKQAPEYLLRYYSTHLKHNHTSAEAFYALISNGWRMAWEELDVSYGGFLGDVDRSWEKAKEYDYAKLSKAVALVQQIKAAFCLASVVALRSNIMPEWLVEVVKSGLRTPAQALSLAKVLPNTEYQIKSLTLLIPHLSDALLIDALFIAKSIHPRALREVVSQLPEHLLLEGLAVARTIDDETQLVETLCSISLRLSGEARLQVITDALSTAKKIKSSHRCAHCINKLAPLLPDNLLADALTIVQNISNEDYCSEALTSVSVRLSEPLSTEALIIARKFKISVNSIRAFSAIVPRLSQVAREQTLMETLAMIKARILLGYHKQDTLVALVPYLPESLLEEALAITKIIYGVYSPEIRVSMLMALAPRFPPLIRQQLLAEATEAAEVHAESFNPIHFVELLAPHLRNVSLEEILTIVITSEYWYPITNGHDLYGNTLAILAPNLPEYLLNSLLKSVKTMKNEEYQARTLNVIAKYLPKSLLFDALMIAKSIENLVARIEAQVALIYYVDDEQRDVLQMALEATAEEIENNPIARSMLSTMSLFHITDGRQNTKAARNILELMEVITGKVRPEAEIKEILERSLSYVKLIGNGHRLILVFMSFISYVTQELRRSIIELIESKVDAFEPTIQKEVIKIIFTAYSISGFDSDILVELVPNLPDEVRHDLITKTFAIIKGIDGLLESKHALGILISRTMDEFMQMELNEFDFLKAESLVMSKHRVQRMLEEDDLAERLSSVMEIGYIPDRVEAVLQLVPKLTSWAQSTPEAAYPELYRILSESANTSRPHFLPDLATLMPFILALAGDEAPQAAEGIYHAIQEVCEWWP